MQGAFHLIEKMRHWCFQESLRLWRFETILCQEVLDLPFFFLVNTSFQCFCFISVSFPMLRKATVDREKTRL